MSNTFKAILDGYGRVTPYLIVDGAAEAIEFYKTVFGATERMRMGAPGEKIGHAELMLGESCIMLADEHPEIGARGPRAIGGTPVTISLYVEDVDTTAARAVEAGAKLTRPVETQFYGDRVAGIEDPFGHSWHLATHVEDVSPEEMERRMAAQHG